MQSIFMSSQAKLAACVRLSYPLCRKLQEEQDNEKSCKIFVHLSPFYNKAVLILICTWNCFSQVPGTTAVYVHRTDQIKSDPHCMH